MFCHQCGNEVSDEAKFCNKCGTAIIDITQLEQPTTYPAEPDTQPEFTDEAELRIFVGPEKADYYLEKWKKAQHPKKQAGFNWAAFFLGPFWLGYRKMYLFMVSYVGVLIAIDYLAYFLKASNYNFAGIVISLSLGIFGNSLYLYHARKQIGKMKLLNNDPITYSSELKRKGGAGAAGILLAIFSICIYVGLDPFVLKNLIPATQTASTSVSRPVSSNTNTNSEPKGENTNGPISNTKNKFEMKSADGAYSFFVQNEWKGRLFVETYTDDDGLPATRVSLKTANPDYQDKGFLFAIEPYTEESWGNRVDMHNFLARDNGIVYSWIAPSEDSLAGTNSKDDEDLVRFENDFLDSVMKTFKINHSMEAPSESASITLEDGSYDAFNVKIPAGWIKSPMEGGDFDGERYINPKDANQEMTIVSSRCAGCAYLGADTSEKPDPLSIIPEESTSSYVFNQGLSAGYTYYKAGNPYRGDGVVTIIPRGGYAYVEITLPDSLRSYATKVLNSFVYQGAGD